MTSAHYLVVVGAAQPLADALNQLRKRYSGLHVIAVPARKHEKGITADSVSKAFTALLAELQRTDNPTDLARLSVWTYRTLNEQEVALLLRTFGNAAWLELIPGDLVDKVDPTRLYIEKRLPEITPLLHEVSRHVFNKRRSTPMVIPLVNFHSRALRALLGHWYQGLDKIALTAFIEGLTNKFRQTHTKKDPFSHVDDRGLIFAPAGNEVCHGQPHPTGTVGKCYLEGRFRFGTAVYPGFHYDVRAANGNLSVTLQECHGNARDLRPEHRSYINVFPNDHLLPQRT